LIDVMREDVFANFVHRRGGPSSRRAVYECRECGGRVHAVYLRLLPDTNRVREHLLRHLASHADYAGRPGAGPQPI